jgi:hypothetical protein
MRLTKLSKNIVIVIVIVVFLAIITLLYFYFMSFKEGANPNPAPSSKRASVNNLINATKSLNNKLNVLEIVVDLVDDYITNDKNRNHNRLIDFINGDIQRNGSNGKSAETLLIEVRKIWKSIERKKLYNHITIDNSGEILQDKNIIKNIESIKFKLDNVNIVGDDDVDVRQYKYLTSRIVNSYLETWFEDDAERLQREFNYANGSCNTYLPKGISVTDATPKGIESIWKQCKNNKFFCNNNNNVCEMEKPLLLLNSCMKDYPRGFDIKNHYTKWGNVNDQHFDECKNDDDYTNLYHDVSDLEKPKPRNELYSVNSKYDVTKTYCENFPEICDYVTQNN